MSDQLLSPEQYARFANQTRGFRLLPPRQLPCAVCFHNTVDPMIPGRMNPSGLDFLAASPVLRSPAAVRAVQSQFGKSVGALILKAECGPMPDSLHGEAMGLLAKLQEPLPKQVAPALRTRCLARPAIVDTTRRVGRAAPHLGTPHKTQRDVHGYSHSPEGHGCTVSGLLFRPRQTDAPHGDCF